MLTRCLKKATGTHKNLFFGNGFVFMGKEGAAEAPSEAPEGEKKPTLKEKYETHEKPLADGVAFDKQPAKVFEALAAKIDGTKSTKAQIFTAMMESYKKMAAAKGIDKDFSAFWKQLEEKKCSKVSIVKEGGEWQFKFQMPEGVELKIKDTSGIPLDTPKPKLETKEEIKKAVDDVFSGFKSMDAVLFSRQYPKVEDFKKAVRDKFGDLAARLPVGKIHSKKYGLDITVGEDGSFAIETDNVYEKNLQAIYDERVAALAEVRKVDTEAEGKEKAEAETQLKGKALREKIFKVKGGPQSGTVKFENWEQYRTTKISDLYPDAEEGDRVDIRRAGMQRPISVVFQAGEKGLQWMYADKKRSAERVKIELNDDLTYHAYEGEKRAPTAPEGITTLGYYRVKKDYSWTDIARSIMYDGSRPRGQDFQLKTDPDQTNYKEGKKLYADSPMMVLEGLDYDYTEEADVKAYAELLKKYNTDKLHVWVVVPKGQNPRIVEVDKEEKKKGQLKKKGNLSHTEAMDEAELNSTLASAYRSKMVEDEDITLRNYEKMKEILNDENLWNYYWSKGLFKGKDDVIRGFALLGVPKDKARKILYKAITSGDDDVIDFSDLLDALEDSNIYKTASGEAGSYSDFKKEYYYFRAASKKNDGKPLSENEQEWYDTYKDDYKKANVDSHWADLNNILTGCAVIMDGVHNMLPTVAQEDGKKAMEARDERLKEEQKVAKEVGKKRFDGGPLIEVSESAGEDAFLQ
ncbi:MAG TPA: hypothetical protein VI588_01475, partial [Candidatus Gracilibacteria bacterium]|nr:hypothetical protein [Candidatus Gracilibacteria bacterium]